MDEYISKRAMLDAVEKLNIIPSIDGTGKPTPSEDFRVQFLGTVIKVPAADVVPVVRCNDCEYYGSRRWCELHSSVFDDNAFCSYGEKRKE